MAQSYASISSQGAPYGTLMSNTEAVVTLKQVYAGFKDHLNGHRTSTELTLLELLRRTHPEFHVTCTKAGAKFDLIGFANAGHATAILESDEHTTDLTRSYKPPHTRLDPEPGKLEDHVRFGRYRYEWEDNEFLLYETEYSDPACRGIVKLHFILSPRLRGVAKESATDELLMAVGAWTTELHEEVYVFDDGYWCKNEELWKSVQGASWDEVILERKMKANLIKDVQGFFDNQQLYKKLSVPWKRGLILHGIPGNGKTISIKALINSLSCRDNPVPSLYVKSFENKCKGEKHSIRTIFDHARRMAPCLLIFEDLDSIVTEENRSYFLNEVDGLESNDGILMIGSTNHLDSLDPAISKRPSRFDRKYNFKIPGEDERAAYCRFWQNKLEGSDIVEFQAELSPIIAKLTEGFSFAYLKELFVITLLNIAHDSQLAEEEHEATAAQSEDGTSSTDGHVVIEFEDAREETAEPAEDTPTTETKGETETETEKPAEAPKPKRVMPEVAIPESLQDNHLLKVIKNQIKTLLDEMDNTKEDDWTSSKKQGGGMPGSDRVVRRGPRVIRRAF